MVEGMSRGVPWSQDELDWQGCRPPAHRVPIPAPGDTVLVRLDAWDEPVEAVVDRVQPVDDLSDPHLAQIVVGEDGVVLDHEGYPVMELASDPWVLVWLKIGPVRTHTREARLRGVPGWLPLDWRTRWRPLPAVFAPLVQEG